jgi:hypothetical protein
VSARQERRRVIGTIANATVTAVSVVNSPGRAGADRNRGRTSAANVSSCAVGGGQSWIGTGHRQTGTSAASYAGNVGTRRLARVSDDRQTRTTDAGYGIGAVSWRR